MIINTLLSCTITSFYPDVVILDILPEYLQVFERVNESHHYNTRHSVNALILPNVGSYGSKSFHYIGAKIWNSLLDESKTTFSKSLFKVRCKKHFMSVLSES